MKKKSGILYIATTLELMKQNQDYFDRKLKEQDRVGDQISDRANFPIWELAS
jgi:hypothetical protein